MPANLTKRKLQAGEVVIGHAVFEFATPGIARILQAAGVDFVTFDMEHAALGIDTIRSMMSYARGSRVSPFVRVPAPKYEYIAGVLDVGAQGVWVPLVESRKQVEEAVDAARYPPVGNRGIAYGIAHDDYVTGDFIETMRQANDEVLLTAMIETARGLENLEEIASYPGLDMIWIGHYDLAASLGVTGDIRHPRMIEAFERLAVVGRKYGKFVGRGVGDLDTASTWIARGYNAVSYSRDILVYQRALAADIDLVRKCIPGGA